jgi:hypothetical protein
MPDVRVIKKGNKKFAVFVQFIQRGVLYSTEKQANAEAERIRDKGLW